MTDIDAIKAEHGMAQARRPDREDLAKLRVARPQPSDPSTKEP